MDTLLQFVFRMSFGMALAMAVTPSRLVTSGYYRIHLWVLMGLNTLAVLAALSKPGHLADPQHTVLWMTVVALAAIAVMASYVGAVIWLYEKASAGVIALYAVSFLSLLGALVATPWMEIQSLSAILLTVSNVVSGGLLLGVTMAAMFLGHWYLNTPTMEPAPLRRLVLLLGGTVLLRMVVSGTGLTMEWMDGSAVGSMPLFVALRWLAGLFGPLILTVMTWQTLKIPNTQSATGILYVGVIGAFIGELTSQLLSVESSFPL